MEEEPQIETFPLSQAISSGGKSIRVEIYRLEDETSWLLELVDEFNNSTVWDDPFDSDLAALTEAKKMILAERIASSIRPEDGKGNGDWR